MSERANRANLDVVQVNMHDAKSNLSQLVERAAAGEDVVIARAGTPVARLVRYEEERATPRPFGLAKGKVWAADDLWASDLDDEFWANVERPMDDE